METLLNKQTLNFGCRQCGFKKLCFPLELSAAELKQLDGLKTQQMLVKRNDFLFEQGDAFKGLFVVRSGGFKYAHTTSPDHSRILAFYFPGEFFGLDAIHNETHPASAQALTESAVCKISLNDLMVLSNKIPSVQRVLMDIASKRCADAFDQVKTYHTAKQKLAAFLLKLSKNFAERGYSATSFQLPMSRKDLSNYLDLAEETMSRLFKNFQNHQWIKTEGKVVHLNDMTQLKRLLEEREKE